jgi:hypothetical protein
LLNVISFLNQFLIIFNILEISIKELLKILILPHTKNIIKLLIQFSLILSLIKLRGCENSNISRLRMIEKQKKRLNHYGKRFFFGFLWILFLFGYCYQSVNVITFRLAQSDHIKRRLLYLCKMVKIATRTKWIIRKIVKDVNCLFISENFPKFAL